MGGLNPSAYDDDDDDVSRNWELSTKVCNVNISESKKDKDKWAK